VANEQRTDLVKRFYFQPAGGSLILVRHRRNNQCCAAIENVGGGRPFEVTFPRNERKHTFATLRSMVTAKLWRRLTPTEPRPIGVYDESKD
jgi:hypothetical protein